MYAQDIKYKYLSIMEMNKQPYGIFFQARLTSKLGRKTIGLGNDKLTALNTAREIDNQIDLWISQGCDIDLDVLKSIAKQCTSKPDKNLKIVKKDDLNVIWNNYVSFHKNMNCWEESYLKTHIQTVTSLIYKCPHQRIEDKRQIVEWIFGDNKRSVQTSKTRFKLVVAAIDWASKQGFISRNWGIEYRDLLSSISNKTNKENQNDDENEIDIFAVKEIYSILDALKTESYSRFQGKHYQYYKFVYFLWLTGCRPSEAIALKWKNVDKGKIIFCEGEVYASGKRIKKKGTKTTMKRYFPINGEIKTLLDSITRNDDYVFTGLNGKPISHQALRRVWQGLLKSMGLRDRHLYQIRHSMISYHANNDFPIHKLCELVGNSEKIIKEYYLKLDIERIVLPDVIKFS